MGPGSTLVNPAVGVGNSFFCCTPGEKGGPCSSRRRCESLPACGDASVRYGSGGWLWRCLHCPRWWVRRSPGHRRGEPLEACYPQLGPSPRCVAVREPFPRPFHAYACPRGTLRALALCVRGQSAVRLVTPCSGGEGREGCYGYSSQHGISRGWHACAVYVRWR